MRDGRPYCLQCFDGLFAEYCDSCGDPISVDHGKTIIIIRAASNKCFVSEINFFSCFLWPELKKTTALEINLIDISVEK